MSFRPFLLTALASTLLVSANSALATNGYFSHGYGVKSLHLNS